MDDNTPPPVETGTERSYGNMLNEKVDAKKKKFTSIAQLKEHAKKLRGKSEYCARRT